MTLYIQATKNPIFVYFSEPKSKKKVCTSSTLSIFFFVDYTNLIDYETCQIEYSAIIFESQVQWYHG